MKKLLFFSMMCLMAAVTITSCDKDSTGTGTRTLSGYVDLGLPSGTKWKTTNEINTNDTCDFFTYDEAKEKFGSGLPTKEQLEELIADCQWTWDVAKKGYKVVGTNGKSIFLPAAGYRGCKGRVESVGSYGGYWSSTPSASDYVWGIFFYSDEVDMGGGITLCEWRSVRLVKK